MYMIERNVTPELAKEYLVNMRNNRNPSQRHIADYANMMRRGVWKISQIYFDKQGRLADGQHRMLAIMKTSIPQIFIEMRDCDEEFLDNLDKGRAKTHADVFGMRGYGDSNILTAMLPTIMSAVESGIVTPFTIANCSAGRGLTTSEIEDFYASNKELIDESKLRACMYYRRWQYAFTPKNLGAVIAIMRILSPYNYPKFIEMLDGLYGMANGCQTVLALRNSLQREIDTSKQLRKTKIAAITTMSLLARVWYNVSSGKTNMIRCQLGDNDKNLDFVTLTYRNK